MNYLQALDDIKTGRYKLVDYINDVHYYRPSLSYNNGMLIVSKPFELAQRVPFDAVNEFTVNIDHKFKVKPI